MRPADGDLPAGKAEAAALVFGWTPDQHERNAPAVVGSAGADRLDGPRQEIAEILPVAGRVQKHKNTFKRRVLRRHVLQRIAFRVRPAVPNSAERHDSGEAGDLIPVRSRHLLERVRRQPPGEKTEQQDRKQQQDALFRSPTHRQALLFSDSILSDGFRLCKTAKHEEF